MWIEPAFPEIPTKIFEPGIGVAPKYPPHEPSVYSLAPNGLTHTYALHGWSPSRDTFEKFLHDVNDGVSFRKAGASDED